MKISYKWLKEYLTEGVPKPDELAVLFNEHSYEVETMEKMGDDVIFEIDILPNRAGDSLCHRGVAKEASVVTGLKFKDREPVLVSEDREPDLSVENFEEQRCPRYMGRLVENIEVRESPEWLKKKLVSLGQRPINNIVDALNYTMFDMGQPMHAFDKDKVVGGIVVRLAKEGERIETLDGKDVALRPVDLVIADQEGVLAIAGVKGGKRAEVDHNTKNIIIESANFTQKTVRITSRQLQIITDASKRYENNLSTEMTSFGMDMASSLIFESASTPKTIFKKIVDVYPRVRGSYKLGASLTEINKVLGTRMHKEDVINIFEKFGFKYEIKNPAIDVPKEALLYMGVPYKYGASVSYDAPRFFDCSSLTSYLFSSSGVSMPRMTIDQLFWGRQIEKDDLRSGDLVFSDNSSKSGGEGKLTVTREFMPGMDFADGVSHVGVYMGEGKILHASGKWHKGEVVTEDLDSSPAFSDIRGYRRMAEDEERFVITVPVERTDLRIKEDLIEEVGRIYGLNNIEGVLPQGVSSNHEVTKILYYAEKIKDILVGQGYDEVRTYSFSRAGEVELLNPVSKEAPYMRDSLSSGLISALEFNIKNTELLGIGNVAIFEIGKVFKKDEETTNIIFGINFTNKTKEKVKEKIESTKKALNSLIGGEGFKVTESGSFILVELTNLESLLSSLPDVKKYDWLLDKQQIKYQKISNYPYVLRDIAVWLSSDEDSVKILDIVNKNSDGLLKRSVLFDRFEKGDRVSHAYHLVFQSNEKTLTDDEINGIMDKVYAEIKNLGFEIR